MVGTASREQPPPVHLKVILRLPDKPEREFSYDFAQPVITMGRDPGNDIQIPLTTVSRRHARIFYEVGDFFLEDLGSTHGTDHNGRTITKGEKRLLRDGDRITVMSFQITFKTTAGTMLDRQPGEKTEQLARRMVQEVLSSLGGEQADPPALRIMNGVDEGKRYELSEDASELTLGRSPDCDITLEDQNVSRRHCLIKRDWHGFTAQDLGSKNGVLLNGNQVQGAQLIKDGDELQVGGVKLIFIDPPSRLLDQMGGLDNATMDPEGVSDTPGQEEAPDQEAEPSYEEPPLDEPDDGPPFRDPAEDLAEPEPELGPEPGDDDEDGPDEDVEVPENLPDTQKGVGMEVIILLLGGVFLLVAVGAAVFLMM